MKNIEIQNKELEEKLSQIAKDFDELTKKFPSLGLNYFFAASFEQDEGKVAFDSFNFNDLDAVSKIGSMLSERMRIYNERCRFKAYFNLPSFVVICVDDSRPSFAKDDEQWVESGGKYIVDKIGISHDHTNLLFSIRDYETKMQIKPFPNFVGFVSERFVPCDYTKLN